MTPARRQIENALIDVKLAIDESLADEDLNTLEAISDIRAHATREIDRLISDARAGMDLCDVMARLQCLRQEIDGRLELH
jgi:hypothetical protein